MDDLEAIYPTLKGNDKINLFLQGYCVFSSIYLAPKRLDFLAGVMGSLSSKLIEKGNGSLMYPMTRLSDSQLEIWKMDFQDDLDSLEDG